MKREIFCEVVRDFNYVYYLNLRINGKPILDLPEYVDYNTLKSAAMSMYGLKIPNVTDLKFDKFGRKSYAYFEFIDYSK